MTPYAVIATGFAVIFGAALVLDLLARRRPGPLRPLGEFVSAALLVRIGRWSAAGRWLVMLAWLWIGFHLLAR